MADVNKIVGKKVPMLVSLTKTTNVDENFSVKALGYNEEEQNIFLSSKTVMTL